MTDSRVEALTFEHLGFYSIRLYAVNRLGRHLNALNGSEPLSAIQLHGGRVQGRLSFCIPCLNFTYVTFRLPVRCVRDVPSYITIETF